MATASNRLTTNGGRAYSSIPSQENNNDANDATSSASASPVSIWLKRQRGPLFFVAGAAFVAILSASITRFAGRIPDLSEQCSRFCPTNIKELKKELTIEEEEINTDNAKLSTDIALLAKLHAALAAERIARCEDVDWVESCERVGVAGARRRSRNLLKTTRRLDNVGSPALYNFLEEDLLESDDPSVEYDENCLRWYRLDLQGNMTFPYHANQLLRAGGSQTMALFIVHGAQRDGDKYFCSFRGLMEAQKYRTVDNILVIAPEFNYRDDIGVYPYDAFWNSTKPWGDWRVGAQSDPECCGNTKDTKEPVTISSFEVFDQMLSVLLDRSLYPNMNKISILGHSAGGQMVQRYAITSLLAAAYDVDEVDWVDMQFVVANPSSYAYLDERRFSYNCGHCKCNSDECKCPKSCTPPSKELSVPNKKGVHRGDWPCFTSHYNDWPYGLSKFTDPRHTVPYVLKSGPRRAAKTYYKRNMVYLVGQNDTCNDGLPVCDSSCWKRTNYSSIEWPCYRNHMDTRCEAMLEGPYRRARGIQYMKYLEAYYGKQTHQLHIIPGIGHDASGMFGSDVGLEVIFS